MFYAEFSKAYPKCPFCSCSFPPFESDYYSFSTQVEHKCYPSMDRLTFNFGADEILYNFSILRNNLEIVFYLEKEHILIKFIEWNALTRMTSRFDKDCNIDNFEKYLNKDYLNSMFETYNLFS